MQKGALDLWQKALTAFNGPDGGALPSDFGALLFKTALSCEKRTLDAPLFPLLINSDVSLYLSQNYC